MKPKAIPFHMGVLLIAVATSSVTFALAAAMTEYAFIKPYVSNLIFYEPNLKLEGIVFNFDAAQTIYPDLQVTVKNYGTATSNPATVFVYLVDSGNVNIATGQGSISGLATGESVTVTVGLTWSQDKNVTNVAGGRVIIKETPS